MNHLQRLIATVLIIFITGLILYETVYPYQLANSYDTELKERTKNLENKLDQLVTTLDVPINLSDNTNIQDATKNQQAILEIISETKTDLNSYVHYSENLKQLKYSGYFGPYKMARARKIDSIRLSNQTNEVLTDYEYLVKYISIYNNAAKVFVDKTNIINSVSNLGTLQPLLINTDSAKIKEQIDILSQLNPPEGLKDSHNNLLEIMKTTSIAFEITANGKLAGNESEVNRGVRIIEAQTNIYDTITKSEISSKVNDSPTIHDVRELPSKTNVLRFET